MVVVVHPPVEVSELDHRTYRAITLPNLLKVLLISDPHSDKAAASMNVSVGHHSDPLHLPGLAHFLEHMVFLATEKFPTEGSYSRFLAENGGNSNAFTSSDDTNFHFEMVASKENGAERYREALDRFSSFFICPLFTESATERELNAVHSEHMKNLSSDHRRIYQLKKSVANPKHPFHKFGTGNKDTLWEIPKTKGIDTRKELLKFHETHYSSNIMALTLVSPFDLDDVQQWVIELFSDIPNKNLSMPSDCFKDIKPLLKEHLGIQFFVETVTDVRTLELVWLIPSYMEEYRSKPYRYVAEVLGDEGHGSILSVLKKKGWADGLSSYPHESPNFGFFGVKITLTKEGTQVIDEIITLVYNYIRLAKEEGVNQWLHEEEVRITNLQFRYRETSSPCNLAIECASRMHQYTPEEYLSGGYLLKEYKPDLVMDLFEHLTPENGNIFLSGKFLGDDKLNESEPWYNTSYSLERISDEKMHKWVHSPVNPELKLQQPNPFIPKDLSLKAEPLEVGEDDLAGPSVILSNEYMCVHHKLDRTFRRPKANVIISLQSPMAYWSPWYAVMSNIFTYLVEDSLTEYSYPAARAGCEFSLDNSLSGLRLTIDGFSDSIDVLLEAIIKRMMTYEIDETRFEMIRDLVERDYLNFAMSQPYIHAMYDVNYVLEEPRWHVNEYNNVFKEGRITLKALSRFMDVIFERMFMVVLVSGNVTEEKSKSMMQAVRDIINFSPLPESERTFRRVVQLPIGTDVYTRKSHSNPADNNSAIDVFYEIAPRGNHNIDVCTELLSEIMSKDAFHELRTVQQLGYIVQSSVTYCDYVIGIMFLIQSTVADPDKLLCRVDEFLTKFRKENLENMSQDKFQDFVSSLVLKKTQPDKTLFSRSSRFWGEIYGLYLQFDRRQKQVEQLKLITKKDILEFFDTYLAKGGLKTRRLVSQVFGNQHPCEELKLADDMVIQVKNPIAFRRQSQLYPCKGVFYPESEG